MKTNITYRGFTLLEVLIAVLIIGILAAVAVPQYKKAVLKSRFSSLMPVTKVVRDAQENYYLINGRYTENIANLDVVVSNHGITIDMSKNHEYAYTKSTRPDIQNNLIMYQKHSVNFPGETHCEALKGDISANWLCKEALQGQEKLGSITEGYKTYIIDGEGDGKLLSYKEEMIMLFSEMGEAFEAFYEQNGRYPSTWEEAGLTCPETAIECHLSGWYPRINVSYSNNMGFAYIGKNPSNALENTRGKVVCWYSSYGTRAQADAACGSLGTLATIDRIRDYGYLYILN